MGRVVRPRGGLRGVGRRGAVVSYSVRLQALVFLCRPIASQCSA